MTEVQIQLPIEGFHSWPGAFDAVGFLRDRHRHTFFVRMGFAVHHDDRDLEIFVLRDMIRAYIGMHYGTPAEFGSMSCESIARILVDEHAAMGATWCEVWEEGTGGAKVTT